MSIANKSIADFSAVEKDSLNTVRTILLFGNNVSTYKFAFLHSLMEVRPSNEVRYTDLRDPFLKHLIRHYETNPNQYVAGANSLTSAIDQYLESDKQLKDWESLVKAAEKNIYNNVFDAFQNVGGGSIEKSYTLFEHDRKGKRLILTDNLNSVLEDGDTVKRIVDENEARWKVVEEAWKHKLSPNLLAYNEVEEVFYSISSINERDRVNLRSAVSVLLPYQNGRCFYCWKKINTNVLKDHPDFPDVDHFLPLSFLIGFKIHPVNPNGIWNLVIACKDCNRGPNGKFDSPPNKSYFDKLLKRNLLFIEEHKHSMKNSILLSLQATSRKEVEERMVYLYNIFRHINGWQPKVLYQ